MTDTIDGSGYPLGFRLAAGAAPSGALGLHPAKDVFVTEARMLAGHQKEAVLAEGDSGARWRLTSDEGGHLKGTDLAPFPLGFFNAGLAGDLINRILAIAAHRQIRIDELGVDLTNSYWMTGSFFRGDGVGHSEPARFEVTVASPADGETIASLVAEAAAASPALASLRTPLTNTFALYVNNRRRTPQTMDASTAGDAPDPYMTYRTPPAPEASAPDDIIVKTGRTSAGEERPTPPGTDTRIVWDVRGEARLVEPQGLVGVNTILGIPAASEFRMLTGENGLSGRAPSGLGLASAAIAFCYLTQLFRYIDYMKLDIRGPRLVQYAPYSVESAPDGTAIGVAGPLDTHLFLSGSESDEVHEQLMRIAARTCYLHATLSKPLDPEISIRHNGSVLERARAA